MNSTEIALLAIVVILVIAGVALWKNHVFYKELKIRLRGILGDEL